MAMTPNTILDIKAIIDKNRFIGIFNIIHYIYQKVF